MKKYLPITIYLRKIYFTSYLLLNFRLRLLKKMRCDQNKSIDQNYDWGNKHCNKNIYLVA
jgi:hypothetical protein